MGEMHVLAEHREGELFRLRLADEARAGVEQLLHRGRGCRRRNGLIEPVGIAPAAQIALDVEYVLDAERQPGERTGGRAFDGYIRKVEESVQPVACLQI